MTVLHHRKRRVLIVNCYADETRRPVARSGKVPQTIGPLFLAGAFRPDRWEIRIHNEHSDGPLDDRGILGWPDLLVLTGLTTSLDRMRHLTAYARTGNPRVRVVGGGHVARAFPSLCATFMDIVCQGDVDELLAVVADLYGPGWASERLVPRFDLGHWIGRIGYAESTKYCNFKCDFCVLSGERRKYSQYPIADLRNQLAAIGKRGILNFNDNNFYGNDRSGFLERVACVKEFWEAGQFAHWGALVTGDFFQNSDNLALVKASGAIALFSGVESFSPQWNVGFNKRQNAVRPQVELIRECLEAGLVFLYGLILDPSTRSLAELEEELTEVVNCHQITLPAFLSLPIPFPGTPWFYQCLDTRALLPGTLVRDLDSTTLTVRPLDPLPQVLEFVRKLQFVSGFRRAIVHHSFHFWRRYHRSLSPLQMVLAQSGGLFLAAPLLGTLPTKVGRRSARRTHLGGGEALDRFYRPAFRVDAKFEPYFTPVTLIDSAGALDGRVAVDIEAARPTRRAPAPRQQLVPISATSHHPGASE